MPAADSLHTVIFAADSLASSHVSDSVAVIRDSVRRIVASDIFGQQSILSQHAAPAAPSGDSMITDPWYFQAMVVALFVLYAYMLFVYSHELGAIFRAVFNTGRDREYDEYPASGGFLAAFAVMGAFGLGIALVRAAAIWLPRQVLESLPADSAFLIVLFVVTAHITLSLIRRLIMRGIGSLTLSGNFTRRILALGQLCRTTAAMVLIPLVVLLALAPEIWAVRLLWLSAALLSLFIVHYLYRSLRVFIKEKVSILLWFLYLCTVEVIPVGILILGILRSMRF